MTEYSHIPVLAKETVSLLAVRGGVFFDGTAGMGGHSRLLLEARNDISTFSTDIDPEMAEIAAANLRQYGSRARVVCGSYANATEILRQNGIETISGALLDLGVSSLHYDKAERGFAFKSHGPLDMRLDRKSRFTAEELVNDWPANQLERIIRSCGETQSHRIVRAIEKAREQERITDTAILADIIAKAVPFNAGKAAHPATRTFMALRIAVNNEFENIRKGIMALSTVMEDGGRIAVITFHSAEDKLVKGIFNDLLSSGKWIRITRKAVLPSPEEVEANPRSRSAQLRVIEKSDLKFF